MSGPAQAPIPGQGISVGIRFICLAILALILMIVDHKSERLTPVREVLGLAVYPILVIVDLPVSAWDSVTESFVSRQSLELENDRLKRQLISAEFRLQELESTKSENSRLRGLLDAKERYEAGRVLVAEILSVDLDPYPQRFMINRGTLDGVFVGQALLDSNGVVGQVAAASLMTAEVILITDANHAIPVSIRRNGIRTIAVGTGDSNRLRLPYLTNSSDVRVGDVLETSGLGGVFPAGRPVATVLEVKPGHSYAEVVAAPISELDRDKEVILVWNESGLVNGMATAAAQVDP